MPRHHALKIWPEFFEPKLNGVKDWEYRNTIDRDYAVGDTVLFMEFRNGEHTGRCIGPVEITYVLEVADDYCVFSHTPIPPSRTARKGRV